MKIKRIIEEGNGGFKLAIAKMQEEIEKENKKYLAAKSTRGGSKFVKGWFK